MTTITTNGVTFYRYVANCDTYGNERLIVHFLAFLTDMEKENLSTLEGFAVACKRAKKMGWKAYRGNNFGGGIVGYYNTTLESLASEINALKGEQNR